VGTFLVDAKCYHRNMSISLNVRDVPDQVHATLALRAAQKGMSLRQYTIGVLTEHCALPTIDEWLNGLNALVPVALPISGAEAVRRARDADDDELAGARHR